MAVAPLFVKDMATLRSRIRLSGSQSADASAAIDKAVLTARVGFYDALKKPTIDQIKATAEVDAPDSDAELARTRAGLCEVNWVRAELLTVLATRWVDASGNALQLWNDEAAAYGVTNPSALAAEIKALRASVESDLGLLAGSADGESQVRASTLSNENPLRMGSSVFRRFAGINAAVPRPTAGFVLGSVNINSFDADLALTNGDSGNTYSNAQASADRIITLPDAYHQGAEFIFLVESAHRLTIQAPGSAVIRSGSLETVPGGQIYSANPGDVVQLTRTAVDSWLVLSSKGSWEVV